MKRAGCLLAPILGLLLACAIIPAMILVPLSGGTATQAQQGGQPGAPSNPAQPGGSVYVASSRNLGQPVERAFRTATISDLGYGPTDGARLDRLLSTLRPRSPMVGDGALLVQLAIRWRIDPLLIAGQWLKETQLMTDGITVRVFNGGNIDWKAAACCTTQTYACRPGPSSLGHTWTACPTEQAGYQLWFDYVATRYLNRGIVAWKPYVNTYNPCWDPFANINCGDWYGREILTIIFSNAGPPATADASPGPDGVGGAGDWYRWQGAPDAIAGCGQLACGPTSVAMVIQYATGREVPVSEIAAEIERRGGTCRDGTGANELQGALAHWKIDVALTLASDADTIVHGVRSGHPVLVNLRMGGVRPGRDYEARSADPKLRRDRYAQFAGDHWIVAKGVSPDGVWLQVHDPLAFGEPGTSPRYWYADGGFKGADRWYRVADIQRAIEAHGGAPSLEITSPTFAAPAAPPPSAGGGGYRAALHALVPGSRMISGWGEPRAANNGGGGKHMGNDLQQRMGAPIYAIEPGVVTINEYNRVGGWSLTVRSDSARLYYFAHFPEASTVPVGARVAPGQQIARVGMSGNAANTVPHLHFQVTPPDGTWRDPEIVLADWRPTNP